MTRFLRRRLVEPRSNKFRSRVRVSSWRDRLIAPTLQAFQAAPCIDGSASSSVVLALRDFCLLIAIDRIKRAGDHPSNSFCLLACLYQIVPNRRFFDASCFCALSAHFDELDRAEEKR